MSSSTSSPGPHPQQADRGATASAGKRWRSLPPGAYVAGGAMVGTLARAVLDALTAPWQIHGLHLSTIAVNLLGAFAMGFLTACWIRERGQNTSWDRLKLLFGTGTLGALTTYSAFALALANSSATALSLALGVGVVLGGIVAVAAGVVAANRWLSARDHRRGAR